MTESCFKYCLVPLVLFFLSLDCMAGDPEKYLPATQRQKEKLETPEPGTYLKPSAHRILKRINKVMEKPEDIKEPPYWLLRALACRQKRVLDTLIGTADKPLPLKIYYPSRQSQSGMQPVILFMHGGGFIMGSANLYHPMVSRLARECDCIVVSVDYRLAPAHPFPAAINDAFLALSWLQENAGSIGADSSRIFVMGDSAGGNLATVLCLMCHDRQRPQPAAQVLIYPAVSFSETITPSRHYFAMQKGQAYVLSEAFLRKVKTEYMGRESNDSLRYLSPLQAKIPPDMPPAMLITAECDPLRDGGRAYAEKLAHEGFMIEHHEYSGMIHGFINFHMLLKEASEAIDEIAAYLRNFYE